MALSHRPFHHRRPLPPQARAGARDRRSRAQHAPDFDQLGPRLQQSVQRFVAALPEIYREAITLADLEDLPVATVAERLAISLPAAKSRIARGRELLRSRLFACCNFEVDRFGTAIDFQRRDTACGCETPPPTAARAASRRSTPWPPIDLQLASGEDGPATRALLRTAELPTADLNNQSWLHFAVARAGERIVGAVGLELHADLALLRSLVVAPEMRSGGVGQRLVAEALRLGRQLGLRELWLLTTTAEAFFTPDGFVTVGRSVVPAAIQRSEEFGALCPDSAVVMRRALAATPGR